TAASSITCSSPAAQTANGITALTISVVRWQEFWGTILPVRSPSLPIDIRCASLMENPMRALNTYMAAEAIISNEHRNGPTLTWSGLETSRLAHLQTGPRCRLVPPLTGIVG